MGQLIFMLLLGFAIICALYGIAEGVQIIQRGVGRVFGIGRNLGSNGTQIQKPMGKSRLLQPDANAPDSALHEPSTAQRCLDELEGLHTLRQKGALSDTEFEQLKRHILSSISTDTEGGI